MNEVNHFRRVVLIWLVSSVILTPIVVLAAQGIPPGDGTVQAAGQTTDNGVLLGLSTPVALAVVVFFLLLKTKINPAYPIVASGLIGLLAHWLEYTPAT